MSPTEPHEPQPLLLDLHPAEYRAFVRHRDLKVHARRFWVHVAAVPAALLAWGSWEAAQAGGPAALLEADPLLWLLPFAVALWVASRFMGLERKARRLARHTPPGTTLTVTQEALVVAGRRGHRTHPWASVVAIEETPELLMVVHKRTRDVYKATLVPRRQDPSGQLALSMRTLWAAAQRRPAA